MDILFRREALVVLLLHHAEDTSPLHVPRLGLHPALIGVDDGRFQDVALAGTIGAAHPLGQEFQNTRGNLRLLQMQPGSMETVGGRIDIAIDDIGCQDMAGVGVWIAEKVGERNSGEVS